MNLRPVAILHAFAIMSASASTLQYPALRSSEEYQANGNVLVLGVLKECKLRWHFGSGSVGMNAELLLFFQAFWFVFCPPA